jgi:hypothetical protein
MYLPDNFLGTIRSICQKQYPHLSLADTATSSFNRARTSTDFDQREQHIDIWNQDGVGTSIQMYPILLSTAVYGLFVNHPRELEFEVGSKASPFSPDAIQNISRVSIAVPGDPGLSFFSLDQLHSR